MAGKAKRQAARDQRKKKRASERLSKRAEYAAKIAAGRNTKSAAKREQQRRLTSRKVRDHKGTSFVDTLPVHSQAPFVRVPPSHYGEAFWAAAT